MPDSTCPVYRPTSLHKDHAKLRQVRVTQEDRPSDRKHLCGWLRAHNPLAYTDTLVYTITGVEADSSIKCDNSVSVRSQQPKEMIGQNLADLELQRNRRVPHLSAMRSTIKVRNDRLGVCQ